MNSKLRHRDFTELFCILLCESADFCNVNCIENMCVREWVQKKKKRENMCFRMSNGLISRKCGTIFFSLSLELSVEFQKNEKRKNSILVCNVPTAYPLSLDNPTCRSCLCRILRESSKIL